MSFIRQHKGAVLWSLTLHVAVVTAIVVGVPWRLERPRVPVATAPIQGVIVDPAAIQRQQAAREEAARQERQRQQRDEQQRREAADRQRQAEQREQQRVAAEQRAREEAAQKERDRVAAERAEQQRREQQAQAERERQAREQREREAQAQREREEADKRARAEAEQRRRQQQAEAELQQQIALEAEQNAARAAGLEDQYRLMIESKIKQHWDRPLSARPGIDCIVNVVQLPTGDVMSASVASCNGDDAVRRSIERAVMDASPLPKPPHPSLFARNLIVNFRPED